MITVTHAGFASFRPTVIHSEFDRVDFRQVTAGRAMRVDEEEAVFQQFGVEMRGGGGGHAFGHVLVSNNALEPTVITFYGNAPAFTMKLAANPNGVPPNAQLQYSLQVAALLADGQSVDESWSNMRHDTVNILCPDGAVLLDIRLWTAPECKLARITEASVFRFGDATPPYYKRPVSRYRPARRRCIPS